MFYYINIFKAKFFRKRGLRFLLRGKGEIAYRYFQKVLFLDNSVENKFNVALALVSLNRYSEAEKYLRDIYRKYPENEMNCITLAECYLMQQDWQKAIEIYRKLLQVKPENTSVRKYLELAEDVVQREKYVRAKYLFVEAQKNIDKKDYSAALNLFLEAETYNDSDANIKNNIAMIYMVNKKFEKAYEYFVQAHSLAPGNEKIKRNLSYVKSKLKK